MYWLWPKRKYDPEPYSRLLRFKHWLFGCPIQTSERREPELYPFMIFCPCGLAYDIAEEEDSDQSCGPNCTLERIDRKNW